MQIRRTDKGGLHVASEAVLKDTGQLIASTSHTTCTYHDVRRYLASLPQAA
jgi:hypothetical protein